ncbi:hypothetical protein [Candidatus Regiella endosymbiont of Tuberolachnus salignus]
MSVDRLRDSVSTRSQQRGGFKGEGFKPIKNSGVPTTKRESSL